MLLKKMLKISLQNIYFARWQAILSIFYFDIEYIKGSQNAIPDFLTVNFCTVTMASRWSKDKTPTTANPILKKVHVSSWDIVNRFTPLGTIPKPNYSSILASPYDPYALAIVNQPVKTVYPNASNASQYVKKQSIQNLFSIKPNRVSITNPFRLATGYFPP